MSSRQPFHHVRQTGQSLDAWIPGLFRHRVGECLVLQILVLLQPLLEQDDFQRIRGCGQDLGQQRVWIKRNRRNQRIQLLGRNLGDLRLLERCRRWRLLRRVCQRVAWHKGDDA